MLKNIFNAQLVVALVVISLITVVFSNMVKADEYTDYVSDLVTQLRVSNADTKAIIADNFGFKVVSKYVAGRKYRKFTASQKTRYLAAYKLYTINTYNAKLTDYINKDIKVINTKVYKNGVIVVKSTVDKIKVSWRISIKSGSPKIVDITVANISMVIAQRTEFSTFIRINGVEKFISLLESK